MITRCARPLGFSLVELLVVLVLLGLLPLLALPPLLAMRNRLQTRQAMLALVEVLHEGRRAAQTIGDIVELEVTPTHAVLRRAHDARRLAVRPLGALDRLDGAPRRHRWAPDGLMLDAGTATYVLRRGAAERRVIVAKYGRVRVE